METGDVKKGAPITTQPVTEGAKEMQRLVSLAKPPDDLMDEAAEVARKRAEEAEEETRQKAEEEMQEAIDSSLDEIAEFKQRLFSMPGGFEAKDDIEDLLSEAKEAVNDVPNIKLAMARPGNPVKRALSELEALAKARLGAEMSTGTKTGMMEDEDMEKVRDLYNRFANAYSSMNLGALTSMISEDWSTSSGSDIGDLEEILDNSFQTFDRIEFRVSAMRIKPQPNGTFEVKYQTSITGFISDQGIKHEEKSEVTEVVGYEDGELRILKTTAGRFWR